MSVQRLRISARMSLSPCVRSVSSALIRFFIWSYVYLVVPTFQLRHTIEIGGTCSSVHRPRSLALPPSIAALQVRRLARPVVRAGGYGVLKS